MAQEWSIALYSQPVAHSNLVGTFSQQWRKSDLLLFIRSQLRIPIWLELFRSNGARVVYCSLFAASCAFQSGWNFFTAMAQEWSIALYSQPVAHSNLVGTFSQQWRKSCISQYFFTMKPPLSIRSQLCISTFIPYFLTCTHMHTVQSIRKSLFK